MRTVILVFVVLLAGCATKAPETVALAELVPSSLIAADKRIEKMKFDVAGLRREGRLALSQERDVQVFVTFAEEAAQHARAAYFSREARRAEWLLTVADSALNEGQQLLVHFDAEQQRARLEEEQARAAAKPKPKPKGGKK